MGWGVQFDHVLDVGLGVPVVSDRWGGDRKWNFTLYLPPGSICYPQNRELKNKDQSTNKAALCRKVDIVEGTLLHWHVCNLWLCLLTIGFPAGKTPV